MQTWKCRKPVCFVSMAVIDLLFYWGGTLTVGRATIVSMVNARTPPLSPAYPQSMKVHCVQNKQLRANRKISAQFENQASDVGKAQYCVIL